MNTFIKVLQTLLLIAETNKKSNSTDSLRGSPVPNESEMKNLEREILDVKREYSVLLIKVENFEKENKKLNRLIFFLFIFIQVLISKLFPDTTVVFANVSANIDIAALLNKLIKLF